MMNKASSFVIYLNTTLQYLSTFIFVISLLLLMLALLAHHSIHSHQTKEHSPSRILLRMYCLPVAHTNDILHLEYQPHIPPNHLPIVEPAHTLQEDDLQRMKELTKRKSCCLYLLDLLFDENLRDHGGKIEWIRFSCSSFCFKSCSSLCCVSSWMIFLFTKAILLEDSTK